MSANNDIEVKYSSIENMPSDENILKTLTIHELRVILKKLGGTPSNKKSADLVQEIVFIQNGGTPPKKSNRGRRPKFIKQGGVAIRGRGAQPFSKRSALEYERIDPDRFSWCKAPSFANGVFAPIETVCSDTSVSVPRIAVADGVLVAEHDPYYVINYDAHFKYPVYLIESSLARTYGLRTGDRVTGYARGIDGSHFTVYEIEKINDASKNEFVRGDDYRELPAAFPKDRFILGSGSPAARAVDLFAPIAAGNRVAVIQEGKRMSDRLITFVLSELENTACVIDLPIGYAPEDVVDLTDSLLKAEVCASDFCDTPSTVTAIVYLYFERAKCLLEQGETVVIAIRGLDKLYDYMRACYDDKDIVISEIKKLLALAKNVRDGGSLTLICSYSKGWRAEFDEIDKLFSSRVYVSESEFDKLGGVDIFKSVSGVAERVCDEAEFLKIEKLRSLSAKNNNVEKLSEIFEQTSDNEEIRGDLDKSIKALS